MAISHLNDYINNRKEKKMAGNEKIILQVMDIDFENNTIIYTNINNGGTLLIEFLDQLLIQEHIILNDVHHETFQIMSKYNTIGKIIQQTYNKTDGYLEKAHYTKSELTKLLKEGQAIIFI